MKKFSTVVAAVVMLSGCSGGNESFDSSEALLQSEPQHSLSDGFRRVFKR